MTPDPCAATREENVYAAKNHEEPHPSAAEEINSSISGPQTVLKSQSTALLTRRSSIPSGLEVVPAEDMMKSAGATTFPAVISQQLRASTISSYKEANEKMTVQHRGGAESGKRRRIWYFLMILLPVIVVAGLGLGVGLSLRKSRLEESPAGSDAAIAEVSNSTASVPMAASTASPRPPRPTTLDIVPPCPGANNTIHTSPQDEGSTRYRRICGVSYDGNDLHPQMADTIGQCLSHCSECPGCAGVVWYNAGLQGTDLNWCWLKRSMKKAVLSYRNEAETAIRL